MARHVVLVLGSGTDAVRARGWRRDGIDRIVAINNAWRIRPDWDHLVYPWDFPPERRPAAPCPDQTLHDEGDFVPAVNAFGGFVLAGGTMAFTTGYWALATLRPRLIAYLGCDMIYPARGRTHFYGRGTADPLRPDPTLQSLEAKSARFLFFAAARGCAVVNLSERKESRLVFPRLARGALAKLRDGDAARLVAEVAMPERAAAARRALAAEAVADCAVPSGRYWEEAHRLDPERLRRIDALWLDALSALPVAA